MNKSKFIGLQFAEKSPNTIAEKISENTNRLKTPIRKKVGPS